MIVAVLLISESRAEFSPNVFDSSAEERKFISELLSPVTCRLKIVQRGTRRIDGTRRMVYTKAGDTILQEWVLTPQNFMSNGDNSAIASFFDYQRVNREISIQLTETNENRTEIELKTYKTLVAGALISKVIVPTLARVDVLVNQYNSNYVDQVDAPDERVTFYCQ